MQLVNMLFPGLPKSILERKPKKRKRKERKEKQWTGKGKGNGQVRYTICEYAFSWQSKKHTGKERKGKGQGKERTMLGKQRKGKGNGYGQVGMQFVNMPFPCRLRSILERKRKRKRKGKHFMNAPEAGPGQ